MTAVKNFAKANGYDFCDDAISNYEGGRGYTMTLEERVRSMARLGLIQNTYYEDQTFIIQRSMATLNEAIASIPAVVMEEAIIGRNNFQMKFMPVLFLVYLSTLEDSSFFTNAFDKVILTAKDLHVFQDLVRKAGIRKGMSRKIRKAMNSWLEDHMSEKLATRNRSVLNQAINCSRPNPQLVLKNPDLFRNAMRYIAKRELTLPRAVALKNVLESLQNGILTNDILTQITEYRLEMEELKSAIGSLSVEDKKSLYEFFIPNFGYAGLCKNLVGIERVFGGDVPHNIEEMVEQMLMNINSFKSAKILPFELITARKMTHIASWKNALDYMLTNAITSSFDIKDHVMTVVDTSDSMTWDKHKVNNVTSAELASTFGAVLKLANRENVDLYAVASTCSSIKTEGETVFDIATDIRNTYVGGGTQFEEIMKNYKGQKFVLLLTDSEQADNYESKWRKANKPEGAITIVWQLAGYPHKISNRSDVIYLFGYSLTLLNTIKNIIEGNR